MIHSIKGATLVYMAGVLIIPQGFHPIDTSPTAYKRGVSGSSVIKGPPLSPVHESFPMSPPAHNWELFMLRPAFLYRMLQTEFSLTGTLKKKDKIKVYVQQYTSHFCFLNML